MSYSVHTLNIENHLHIIGRQDGVTGDTIKANDEIVFCAACQSVFLKDSWVSSPEIVLQVFNMSDIL